MREQSLIEMEIKFIPILCKFMYVILGTEILITGNCNDINSKSVSEQEEKYNEVSSNKTISEEVQKEIARLNEQIDAYSLEALTEQLTKCKLKTEGHTDVLRKRLKIHYRNISQASSNVLSKRKLVPYYVVIDFEATCKEITPDEFPHEIIEFPAVLINTVKQSVVDYFHLYVKPVLNPRLTHFCTSLTGITQQQVDNAEEFPEVLKKFEAWLKKHKLGTKHRYAIVTDSNYDLRLFLYIQCMISRIPHPSYGKRWVNLKKVFKRSYKCTPSSLEVMLDHFDMEFVGRPHSGIDDAKNIARVLLRIIEDGVPVQTNNWIHSKSWVPKFDTSLKVPNLDHS